MDRQEPVVGEDEHDHLEEVAGVIRPDGELLRRVAMGARSTTTIVCSVAWRISSSRTP